MNFLNYSKILLREAGSSIAVVSGFAVVSAFFSSVGFLLFIPIFALLSEQERNENETSNRITELIFYSFEKMGLEVEISNLLMFVVVAFLAKGFFTFLSGYAQAYFVGKLAGRYSSKLLTASFSVNLRFLSKEGYSFIVNSITEQVPRFIECVNQFIQVIIQVGYFCVYFYFGSSLLGIQTLFVGIGGILFVVFAKFINKRSIFFSESLVRAKESFISVLLSSLHGFHYLVGTGRSSSVATFLSRKIDFCIDREIKINTLNCLSESVREPFAVVLLAFIIFWEMTTESIAGFGSSVVAMGLLYRALGNIGAIQSRVQGVVSFGPSLEYLDSVSRGLVSNVRLSDGLIFENLQSSAQPLVTIRELKVDDVGSSGIYCNNLEVFPGRILGFQGASGSGKTSFLNILCGLINPSSGSVIFRTFSELGEEGTIEKWRESIGYVTQETFLFEGSILSNITMSQGDVNKSSNDDNVLAVDKLIERLSLKSWLAQFPDGLNTFVSDDGKTLSGGQRKIIVLLRELFRKPRLLLLDEVTSGLDSELASFILGGLRQIVGRENVAVILISHDVRLREWCDDVVTFIDGVITFQHSND